MPRSAKTILAALPLAILLAVCLSQGQWPPQAQAQERAADPFDSGADPFGRGGGTEDDPFGGERGDDPFGDGKKPARENNEKQREQPAQEDPFDDLFGVERKPAPSPEAKRAMREAREQELELRRDREREMERVQSRREIARQADPFAAEQRSVLLKQRVIWPGPPSASREKINKTLDSRLTNQGLDFSEVPLEEVVLFLREEYELEVQIDTNALEDYGIGADELVTVNLRNISLRSGLRLMLRQIELTTIIRDEVLLITTVEGAEQHVVPAVYPVSDLVKDAESMDILVDAIISTVSSETWAENGGGESEICALEPGILVVTQSQQVHRELTHLLNAIRQARLGK